LFVSDANLVGGESGLGQGFYLQMRGFENGRLQTAARAIGVMQASYEAARSYAADRVVFGSPIAEYQLTRVKLARMAVLIQAPVSSPTTWPGSCPREREPWRHQWSRPMCAGLPSGHPRGPPDHGAWATPRSFR